MAGATWNYLLPSHFCVPHTNTHQFTVSLHSRPHTLEACVFSCNLLHSGNMGGTDTEISLSTKSWPWRRKFSRHSWSCQDLNPRLFNRVYCSTTVPSLLPNYLRTVHTHTHTHTHTLSLSLSLSLLFFLYLFFRTGQTKYQLACVWPIADFVSMILLKSYSVKYQKLLFNANPVYKYA